MQETSKENLTIVVTPDLRRRFEEEAERLHLSTAAYLVYLMARTRPEIDPRRLDRMVEAVFGQYGQVMRRLAK